MNNYPRKILNYKPHLETILDEFNDRNIINKIYNLQQKVNTLLITILALDFLINKYFL